MARLTKRTAEQLRSHLSSLSAEELVDVLGPKASTGSGSWPRSAGQPSGLRAGRQGRRALGANYRITRVMERPAELAGDVDAIVAVKSRDLSMPYDWLEVAEVYTSANRHAEALDWAERGVAAFPDQHDPRLDDFLCEAYHRADRHAEAVDLAWRRFESRPDLVTYQRLATHAAEASQWPE